MADRDDRQSVPRIFDAPRRLPDPRFVLVYKIGDAMGQVMLAPMIVELGFSDTEYVAVNKFVGSPL